MKSRIIPLVCVLLPLTAACTGARFAPLSVQQVLRNYRSIEKGMTEKQVAALLGRPDRIGRDGTRQWWVDGSEGQTPSHADLDVVFDGERKVQEATVRVDEKLDPTGPCLQPNVTIPHTAFSL